MADIFISYKSERRAAAEHLAEILADYGYSVWWDYALVSGNDFGAQIEREIRAAKAVIVLWCSLSRDSEWVKEEASLAKRLSKIIPTRIETIDLPLGFSMSHTLELTDWDGSPHGRELEDLIKEIARLVGRKPKPNRDGLNRTERAWRRYGAPALRDFALIDELERKRPPRTLPGAIGAPAHVAKSEDRPERSRTLEPNPLTIDEASEAESEGLPRDDWRRLLPKEPTTWLRAVSMNRTVLAVAAALIALFAVAYWRSTPQSKPDPHINTASLTPTNPQPTAPAAPEPAPTTPAPAEPTPPPTQVSWKICNKSSNDRVHVSVAYIADENAGTNLWTYDGWWTIKKGECGVVKKTKSKTLLVRAEASDTGPFWAGDKEFCLLSARYSNYVMTLPADASCPSTYSPAKATQHEAAAFGIFPIDLTD